MFIYNQDKLIISYLLGLILALSACTNGTLQGPPGNSNGNVINPTTVDSDDDGGDDDLEPSPSPSPEVSPSPSPEVSPSPSPDPSASPGAVTSPVKVSAGTNYTCAVSNANAAYCWGQNYFGQLGSGTADGIALPHPTPTPVMALPTPTASLSIAAGTYHTCAIIDGKAYCWGQNYFGALGNGIPDLTFSNYPTPTPVVDLIPAVSAISLGVSHTCAIAGGIASCWGMNNQGQLGNGSVDVFSHPAPSPVVGLGSNVTAITSGKMHTCAIESGAAKCWGSNIYGQLGNGDLNLAPSPRPSPVQVTGLESNVTAISAGGYLTATAHTCAIVGGAAKCWGSNNYGQLGYGFLGTTLNSTPVLVNSPLGTITAISAGGDHTCMIVNGAIYCWGNNSIGQLGESIIITHRVEPGPAVDLGGRTAISVSAGATHTCAVLDNATIKCWGDGLWGQTGVDLDMFFPAI